jgi:hypothetical protein
MCPHRARAAQGVPIDVVFFALRRRGRIISICLLAVAFNFVPLLMDTA